MEHSTATSSLKRICKEICKELGQKQGSNLYLAIWEMVHNLKHRTKGTEAKVSIITNCSCVIVRAENEASEEEIRCCLENKCLPQNERLMLDHLRGEVLIRRLVGHRADGTSNYQREYDPFIRKMVSTIRIPTNKN